MRRLNWSLVVAAPLILVIALVARAADEKKTEKTDKVEGKAVTVKLTQPWSKLTTLSDDQKTQISDIHQKALAQIKAIHDKEEADIMGLLNDEQKAELKKLQDDEKAAEKAKRADKKKETMEEPK